MSRSLSKPHAPSHRAERQRLHRELMEQRMVAEVRKADFVVVNPDHIAVALRYDRDGEAAPVVVRGPTWFTAPTGSVIDALVLARSLRGQPEGEEIPAALYEAGAEVLRVLYGMEAPAADRAPAPASAPPEVPRGAGWKRA